MQLPFVTGDKWRVTRKLRASGLKIKFDRFLQVGHGFLPRGAEAGHVHVEALGDEKFIFPVNDVVHLFHRMNLSAQAKNCNHTAMPEPDPQDESPWDISES